MSGAVLVGILVNVVLIGALVWYARSELPVGVGALIVLLILVSEINLFRALVTAQRQRPLGEESPDRLTALVRNSDRIKRGAIRDEVTGLYHHWYLEVRLGDELERCKRYNLSLAVLVLRTGRVELDAFSADEWQIRGAEAASVAARTVRTVDLTASLGPLEFAICLVHCDRAGAEMAAQRIVNELNDFDCSVGMAIYPIDDYDAPALIELARGRLEHMAVTAAS
jgi:GGDEF domain-containing protein